MKSVRYLGKRKGGFFMDIVYLGVVFLFFALTWGFLKLCEGLLGEER
jgi:hypothetical protein